MGQFEEAFTASLMNAILNWKIKRVVPLMKEAQKCGRRRKRGRRQTEVDGKTK
jgi:hypothetical protein